MSGDKNIRSQRAHAFFDMFTTALSKKRVFPLVGKTFDTLNLFKLRSDKLACICRRNDQTVKKNCKG